MSRDRPNKKPLTTFGAVLRIPTLLTDSTLFFHNLCADFKEFNARQKSSELHRVGPVGTWITSLASTRSVAGWKGRSSVTRSRNTVVSKRKMKSQGKRTREMAESRVEEESTSVPRPTKKRRAEGSKRRTKDTNSDLPSQVNEGLVWRYREDEDEGDEECEYRATLQGGLEGRKRHTKDTNSDPPSQVNEGLVWRYREDEDEGDEECEYRAALLGVRSNISLAITQAGKTTTLIPPRTYESHVERPNDRIKTTNSGLPHGVHDNDDWHKKFIPTYKKWLGTRAKPWIIDEDESIAALQVIWRAVYPHIDYIINAKCRVYRMANPRVHGWLSDIDSAAIDLFKSYYEDLGFLSKETISDASRLLQNNLFMYAETTGETQKKYHGLFRSSSILALMAGHYDSISGAIRIPELEHAFSRDQQKLVNSLETRLRTLDTDSREALEIAVKLDTMRMYPMGALAVCITAVERALGIFAPAGGACFTRYSNKWVEKVQKYSDTIKRKLRPGSMEDIVLKACPFMDADTNISSISVQVLNDSDDEETSSGRCTYT